MARVLNVLVVIIAVLLGLVGLQAATDPTGFMAQYGFAGAQPKGVAEIRCFFGGNFLAYTAIIAAGYIRPDLRRGAWFAVALAMAAIGVLRVVAILRDGAVQFNLFALGMELLFAVILFLAGRNATGNAATRV